MYLFFIKYAYTFKKENRLRLAYNPIILMQTKYFTLRAIYVPAILYYEKNQ